MTLHVPFSFLFYFSFLFWLSFHYTRPMCLFFFHFTNFSPTLPFFLQYDPTTKERKLEQKSWQQKQHPQRLSNKFLNFKNHLFFPNSSSSLALGGAHRKIYRVFPILWKLVFSWELGWFRDLEVEIFIFKPSSQTSFYSGGTELGVKLVSQFCCSKKCNTLVLFFFVLFEYECLIMKRIIMLHNLFKLGLFCWKVLWLLLCYLLFLVIKIFFWVIESRFRLKGSRFNVGFMFFV